MGGDVAGEVAEEVVDLAGLDVGGEAGDEEGAQLVARRRQGLRAVEVAAICGRRARH